MIDIKNKQNSPEILELLFLQRIYCEKIENSTILIYIFTLSILVVTLYSSFNYMVILLNILLTILINAFLLKRKNEILIMASIKEIIDRNLFNLKLEDYKLDYSQAEIQELLVEFKNNEKKYLKESTNNGTDKYKGVKDWYSYDDTLDENKIILSCQKQNCYFTKQEISKSNKCIFILLITFLIVFIYYFTNLTIKNIIIFYLYPSISLIILFYNDYQNYKEYQKIINKVNLKIDNTFKKNNILSEDLKEIQHYIFLVRKSEYRPPLRFIHSFTSNKLHKNWESLKNKF